MAKKGYYNSGAWNGSKVSHNVKLPDIIPCDRCGKKKGHHSYSKKRLDDLKDHTFRVSRFDAAKEGYINCMMCSGAGAQQLELFCVGCDKTLPHTSFNKTQRRTPDNARCEPCQAKRNQYEPNACSDDDDSGHGGSSDGSDDFGDDTSTMAGTFSSLSMNGSSAGGGVSLNGGYGSANTSQAPSNSNRDVDATSTSTTETMRSGWTMTTAASKSTYSGGAPHLRARGAASSSRSNAGSSGGGKFAKVRASDAVPRNDARPSAKPRAAPAPAAAPGAHDDDDICVASDVDSDD